MVAGRDNPRNPLPADRHQQWAQPVLNEARTCLNSQKSHAPGVLSTWRQYHAEEIAAFLRFRSPPNKHNAVGLYYCGSSQEAANSIDSGVLLVIDQQQPFPWNGPPLNDCFQRLSDPECLRRLQPRSLTRNGPMKTRSLKARMRDPHWVSIPTRPRDTVNTA